MSKAPCAPANLCACVCAHRVTHNRRCRNQRIYLCTGTYAHTYRTYFGIISQFRSYLLCLFFFSFRGRFGLEALPQAIVVHQTRLINNPLPCTSFHPRFLFGFHITRVIKGLVVMGRVRTGKDGIKGPFLMDCSRLNSIPGGNKKRGFI